MTLPIADHWFETRRLSDDITLIWEPHVDPYTRCNIWHVRGRDSDALVDSGMGLASLKEHISLVTEKPLLCVASHSHFDHAGGHHEFEERLIHRAEADILAEPSRSNTLVEGFVGEETFTAAPYEGFDPDAYAIRPAPPTRLLEEGDVIDLGDRHLDVLHLPGHSPGSIALWEVASATLFSGDIVFDGPLFDQGYHSNIEDYVQSMQRLRTTPVRTVHGGHYASFGAARFHQLIDEYLAGKRPGCPSDGQGG